MFIRKRYYQIVLMGVLLLASAFSLSLFAQDDIGQVSTSTGNVLIKGPVQAINVNIVTIANLDIILDLDDDLLDDLSIDDVISVEGNIFRVGSANTAIIIPIVVTRLDTPIVVPVITLTGPVESIEGTTISIYGINLQLAAGDPLLTNLSIGDVVVVDGNLFPNDNTFIVIVVTIILEADINDDDDNNNDDDDNDDLTVTPAPTLENTPEVTPAITPEATSEVTPEATPLPGGSDDDDDDDDDESIIIVVEGPVTNINVNIITIYDIDIQINVDDPILTVIQIGDVIRVEGEFSNEGTTIIIVAVTIVYIDIDVVVSPDGEVWRGDNCANPPPPWAPANGWRRRCGGGGGGNSNGGGNNNPPGRGNRGGGGDDDDD